MNTNITRINGQNLTQDSQIHINKTVNSADKPQQNVEFITATGAEVAQNIANNIAEVKQTAQQMQKLSDNIGRKVLFSVNQDLGKVVIKVVNSNTNELIREIPSAEVQQLQTRLKRTIGILFDTTI